MSIAILGAVMGVSSFVVSVRADRRAERADNRAAESEQRLARAEENGLRAEQRELWTELIGAMQEVVGATVLTQDLRPVLVRVRSAMSELVDGVSNAHYRRLDRWMTVEHQVINGLLERTKLQLEGNTHSMQEIEGAHRAPNEWAATFTNNLRLARKSDPSELEASIEEVIAAGEKALTHLPPRSTP